MKILHVVYSCVPGQFRGGTPKVAYELARAQAELGHEVMVYTTNRNSSVSVDVPLGTVVESDGVGIHYFRATNSRRFRSPDLRKALLASYENYDAVHGHNTFLPLNSYIREIGQLSGKPVFYHVHGALDPTVVNQGLFRRLRKEVYIRLIERKNLNRAAGIFALTANEAKQLHHYGITGPVTIISNGVNVDDFDNGNDASSFREQLGIQADQQIVLSLGRIVQKKGVHVLINAFATVQKDVPTAVLVIVGDRNQDPAYVRYLDGLIEEHGLGRSVFWPGFLGDDEKGKAFNAATVFSHISESEGMAMAILEGMAMGVPTLVSKECYMTSAARAGALLECENSVESLYNALAHVLTDAVYRRQLGKVARQYARQNHSWAHLAEEIVQVYKQAMVGSERIGSPNP